MGLGRIDQHFISVLNGTGIAYIRGSPGERAAASQGSKGREREREK